METLHAIIGLILAFVALTIGIFGFGQIFISLFFAIPYGAKLKKEGILHPSAPVASRYIITIFIWVVLLFILTLIAYIFLQKYFKMIKIGLIVSAAISLLNTHKGANRKEFLMMYMNYLLDDSLKNILNSVSNDLN